MPCVASYATIKQSDNPNVRECIQTRDTTSATSRDMSFTTPALQVQRLSMQAVLPGTSSLRASDYTLHSAYDLVVPAHGKALVRTDCAVSAPPGFRLGVFALPGFAWVHHVSVSAASTDRRGVAVVLFNHSDTPLDIAAGAAIALLVLERVGALVVQVISLTETESSSK